jgi:hypothetical protein
MLTRKFILSMTVATGVAAVPVLAFGQATSGGSSTQPQATQTMPQASSGNTSTPRDGTPGNPPSTATQRAADSITGNRTPADGTPGNPPGTAVGRATDRALGTNMSGANPSGSHAASTTTTTTTMTTTTGPLAVDAARAHDGRRASKVIGSSVYGENNESIGSVDDLIIPRDGGNPVAVLSVGGFLGIGAKLVAVPYERLQYNADRERWMLPGATKEALTSLPTYAYDSERASSTSTGATTNRPGATSGGGAPLTPASPNPPAMAPRNNSTNR